MAETTMRRLVRGSTTRPRSQNMLPRTKRVSGSLPLGSTRTRGLWAQVSQ